MKEGYLLFGQHVNIILAAWAWQKTAQRTVARFSLVCCECVQVSPELIAVGRTYQTDIVPASMRGAVVGSIQLFIQFGQIMASGINRVYSTETAPKGYVCIITFFVLIAEDS